MKRERFEQRLFRIFAEAGYSPIQILTVTPEEMVEIPGITVPNIRAVLCVQNKVLSEKNTVRKGRLVEALMSERDGLNDYSVITAERCSVVSSGDDLNGKIIVIKPEALRQEYRAANHQLKLCTGGFGASPNSRGSACFCTDLFSGKQSRFERRDILGTMEPGNLPRWAKDGLAAIQQTEKSKSTKTKEAR